MAESGSAFEWSNFQGGEWSPNAQGRVDLPGYRTALNLSDNGQPLEEGAWIRRSGRRRLGTTNYGAPGVVRTFWLPQHLPAVLELTYYQPLSQAYLRFWVQQFDGMQSDDMVLLCDAYQGLTTISTGTPAIVTIAGPPAVGMNGATWSTGDTVLIHIDPSVPIENGPAWVNRQFTIHKLDAIHYELYDNDTGFPIDGSLLGFAISDYGFSFVGHVARFNMPYSSLGEVRRLRLVQTGTSAYLLSKVTPPITIKQIYPGPSPISTTAPWFRVFSSDFIDGPFLDALPGSSSTGNSVGQIQPIDGNNKGWFAITDHSYFFQPTDVGRQIRVWSQPPQYIIGNTYNAGDRVTWQGVFYRATAGTSATPGTDANWYIDTTLARWGFGKITELDGANPYACRIQYQNPTGSDGGLDNDTITGNGPVCDTWMIGVYTYNQQPSCGAYYEGRIFLAGALPNRVDSCMSDGGGPSGFVQIPTTQSPLSLPSGSQLFSSGMPSVTVPQSVFGVSAWGTTQSISGPLGSSPLPGATINQDSVWFSPTNAAGSVYDNHGISLVLNTPEQDTVNWLAARSDGLGIGTAGGEHLLSAADGTGSITPTSATVKQISKYGAGNVEPLRVGSAVIFVQTFARRVMEYLADIWSRRFFGRHLNEYAKHLHESGVIEMAYLEESAPTVWACANDGSLTSCVYRRVSSFPQEDPKMMGWSRYTLPDDRFVWSITNGTNHDGTLDQLVMLTVDERPPAIVVAAPAPPLPQPPPSPAPPPPPPCVPITPCAGGGPAPGGCNVVGSCVGIGCNACADCGCASCGCGCGCGCGGCGASGCGCGCGGCGGSGDGDGGCGGGDGGGGGGP